VKPPFKSEEKKKKERGPLYAYGKEGGGALAAACAAKERKRGRIRRLILCQCATVALLSTTKAEKGKVDPMSSSKGRKHAGVTREQEKESDPFIVKREQLTLILRREEKKRVSSLTSTESQHGKRGTSATGGKKPLYRKKRKGKGSPNPLSSLSAREEKKKEARRKESIRDKKSPTVNNN